MDMLAKPKYGEKCNQCGRCCISSRCPVGMTLFGHADAPCPALQPGTKPKLDCGVYLHPERYFGNLPQKDIAWVRKLMGPLLGIQTYCEFVQGNVDELRSTMLGPQLREAHKGDIMGNIKAQLAAGMPRHVAQYFVQLVQSL